MEQYDSSIETKKHIQTVGKYIDIICNKLDGKTNFNEKINEATLADLLVCLSNM